MKTRNVLLIALLSATTVLAGCAPTAPPEPPPGEDVIQLSELTSLVGKELLYLGPQAGSGSEPDAYLLMDPADDDRVYSVSGADAARVLSGVDPFSELSIASNPPDGVLFITTLMPPLRRNVPVLAAADTQEAVENYPAALFDCFLFSSAYQGEYAVEEYVIKSAAVLGTEGRRTTIELVADVKPVNNPFASSASRWGEPGADGYVRDRRLILDLYGNDGLYYAYEPEWGTIFAEGAPPVAPTVRETLYQPESHPNIWQALTEGRQVEQVLYEDDTYSFITHVVLRGAPDQQYCDMTLYRVERATGERMAMFDLLRDTFAMAPLALHGRTLYLQTIKAFPNSEAYKSHVTSIDLDTFEYTVLLTEQTDVLGRVGDHIYFARLVGPESDRPGGIYVLTVSTGEMKRVSDLPGPSYSTSYEGSALMRFAGGRLYVLWPDWEAGEGQYALYAIDPVSGSIEEQP